MCRGTTGEAREGEEKMTQHLLVGMQGSIKSAKDLNRRVSWLCTLPIVKKVTSMHSKGLLGSVLLLDFFICKVEIGNLKKETHRLWCCAALCAIRLPLKVPSPMDEFDFGTLYIIYIYIAMLPALI